MAWVGISAPVTPTLCSTTLEYKYLDLMGVYKRVAYIRSVLGGSGIVHLVGRERREMISSHLVSKGH
jgi:hypothetical protein